MGVSVAGSSIENTDTGVAADGTGRAFLVDGEGNVLVSQAHGRRYEQGVRANFFGSSTHAVNGVTVSLITQCSPIAASAAPACSLYNPFNSGINVSVMRTNISMRSGTPGVGCWAYNIRALQNVHYTSVMNNNGVNGGTPLCFRGGTSGGKAKIYQANTLTLAGAFKVLMPLGGFFGAAYDGTNAETQIIDNVNGAIVLPPGTCLALASPAIGSSAVYNVGMYWYEVPIE